MRRKGPSPHNFFGSSDDGGLMNLTPLLDVLFVVLIFFIMLAPLLDFDHIELAAGKHETIQTMNIEQITPIMIQVFKDNTVALNKKTINLQELENALSRLHQTYPTGVPQIFHDKDAPFGTYQAIKTSVEKSGFDQMDIILSP